MKYIETVFMVEEFRKKFNLESRREPTQKPDPEQVKLLLRLINEELGEFKDGVKSQSVVGMLDGLCDIQYLLDQLFCICGLQEYKWLAMCEVHRSNMSKLGDDGFPVLREDGKILKGPNYFAPYLHAILSGEIQ